MNKAKGNPEPMRYIFLFIFALTVSELSLAQGGPYLDVSALQKIFHGKTKLECTSRYQIQCKNNENCALTKTDVESAVIHRPDDDADTVRVEKLAPYLNDKTFFVIRSNTTHHGLVLTVSEDEDGYDDDTYLHLLFYYDDSSGVVGLVDISRTPPHLLTCKPTGEKFTPSNKSASADSDNTSLPLQRRKYTEEELRSLKIGSVRNMVEERKAQKEQE